MVQWVKDLVLLQLWCWLQLRLRFDPWPGNFHMLWVWPKKIMTKKALRSGIGGGKRKAAGGQGHYRWNRRGKHEERKKKWLIDFWSKYH